MDHPGSFAQWLRAQRHARGLTQATLAARLGCSVQTLSRLEKGRTRPSAAMAQRLAAAFDIASGAETTFLAWAPAPEGPTHPTPDASAATRPTGTVTFLFTDVEGSTQLWEHHHAWMEQANPRHERILRDAVAAQRGWAYKQIGDAFQAAFPTALAALAAAVAAQQRACRGVSCRMARTRTAMPPGCACAWACTRVRPRSAPTTTSARCSTGSPG